MTLNTFLAHPGPPSLAGAPSSADSSTLSDPSLHYSPHSAATVIERLRTIRNSIIGSRTKKSSLVNTASMHDFVHLLRIDLASSPHALEIVALASTIVASLSNTPAPHTLLQLLRAGIHDALIDSLKALVDHLANTGHHFLATTTAAAAATTGPLKLLEAVLRALRSILLAIADGLSASPRWGIGSAWGTSSVSSGVAIPAAHPGPGGLKVVGISSRESRLPSATHRPRDVTMASASSEDLRAQRKRLNNNTELDQLRELRSLSRSFLTAVYSPQNLPYLVGPLFISRIPLQGPAKLPRPQSPATASAGGLRDVAMHSRASSSVGMSSPALGATAELLDGKASATLTGNGAMVDVDELPLATRSKILSITEMVCATIAGTVYIPGHSGGRATASRRADSAPAAAESPDRELAERRERLLDFAASDSPYLHPSQRPAGQSSTSATDLPGNGDGEARGRSHQDADVRGSSGFQAELIRKGSRSRSRIKEATHGGNGSISGDAGHLPLWEEEEASLDRAGAGAGDDEGPATVLSVLLAASECGFSKVQEAALWCLAELTRENADASIRLFRFSTPSGTLPTSMLLNLRRAMSPGVRLAAFCCLAHIIKVHPFTPRTNQCVLEVLIELLDQKAVTASGAASGAASSLSSLSSTASPTASLQAQSQVQIQVQAAFAIARLVADEPELQTLAADNYDALGKLTALLDRACSQSGEAESSSSSPALRPSGGGFANPTMGTAPPAVDEGLIRLREACLSAMAALTFQQDELRRRAVDTCTPSVLSMLVPCLTFPALGVRVAACRLTRALSRSISILRTSLVDAGIAAKLVGLINDEDEDEAVKVEATAAICNLMTDFSPMRKLVMEQGGLDRLVAFAHGRLHGPATSVEATSSPDSGACASADAACQDLRLNALWALKNMLWKCEKLAKVEVLDKLGWDFVVAQALDGEMVMREQALNILRNAAVGTSDDVEMVVCGVGGGGGGDGGERLMDLLEKTIWECKDAGVEGASTLEQTACLLVNLATGSDRHKRLLLRRPNLLDALVFFSNHPWKEIRCASAKCISNLLFRPSMAVGEGSRSDNGEEVVVEATNRLRSFGIEERLRSLCTDAELDVAEKARVALKRFELALASASAAASASASAVSVSAPGGGGVSTSFGSI
ncbi:uncharacterized protein PFL1_03534 [Pseudozyma flocculosa PF-1]|uniref:Armadillo repeat-containing protein 8 n=2 Tax=Pseudozyma flocculosa TaxID=84751 RepID=A0A5C3F4T7_9BASI|nr:uncharacterized protein PFL1_03534 [Pseudozyma flocculosa PF-1]EPQ28730.1 hypothetical protein PFL1_03534 [Pseudozyma flocculosa PF-1]SPO39498.1 uncharacterized protein PSFLO_04979 [Pseudozyma flocculosa]